MIVLVAYAFLFCVIQVQGMKKELNTREENYIETSKFVVNQLLKEVKNKHLDGFSEKFDNFLKKVDILIEKDILTKEKKLNLCVDEENIYGLKGSLIGPCLVGIKYRIYTEKDHLPSIIEIQREYGIKVFDFDKAEFAGSVRSRSEQKSVDAVEIPIKKKYQLFSDEFYENEYSTLDNSLYQTNQYAKKWNYLGGKLITKNHGKNEEYVTRDDIKFGNVLLIPGISSITTQNIHSQLLAIATSCYLVKCYGITKYKQHLNAFVRKRFPNLSVGVENISDFDIVLKIHKKIADDQYRSVGSNASYYYCKDDQEKFEIGYNDKTFDRIYNNDMNKNWDMYSSKSFSVKEDYDSDVEIPWMNPFAFGLLNEDSETGHER